MNQIIVISPNELQTLIQNAVNVAVSQFPKHQPVDVSRKYLTISEASAMLNLAKPTIYTLVSKKKIPFIKITKKLYFSANALNEWLESNTNSAYILKRTK